MGCSIRQSMVMCNERVNGARIHAGACVHGEVRHPAACGHDAHTMPLCQWFWLFKVDLDLRKERESAQLLKD